MNKSSCKYFYLREFFIGHWLWNSHICNGGGLADKKGCDYQTCSQVR